MKRRQFIQSSVVVASSPLLLTGCDPSVHQGAEKITGFIISDAHIGWRGKDQPCKAEQRAAIDNITARFPDLDLVFDTGDVHHGNLREPERAQARAFWLSAMAGQFPTALFHYIPGNHELGRGLQDAELTACQLGSVVFRPYYSFDYQGIHFIALPQLQDTILISQESLNWLQVDLQRNANKTTVVFSHNSIKDTTYNNNATGYRVTVNSDQVTDLLDQHGQVVAWFHGHNHQYEIVQKNQRMYVSNGRIGGFNPPQKWGDFGQGHLGGVYFELDATGLTVKCYSATAGDFFENLGKPHLSQHMAFNPTLNPAAACSHNWGHGMLQGSSTHVVHNHYLTPRPAQAMLVRNPTQFINANPDLRLQTDFRIDKGATKKLIGFQVTPKQVQYQKTDQGVTFTLPAKLSHMDLTLPLETYGFGRYLSRSGYYRCELGDTYQLLVSCDAAQPLKLEAQFKIQDINHTDCYQSEGWLAGVGESEQTAFQIKLPDALSQPAHDHRLYLFIKLRISGTGQTVHLRQMALQPMATDTATAQRKVQVSGQHWVSENDLIQAPFNQSSSLIKPAALDVPMTLYVKSTHIQWQVRNATAELTSHGIKVANLRQPLSAGQQIVITPTQHRPFYVNELRHIGGCEIHYQDHSISLHDIKTLGEAQLVVVAEKTPLTTTDIKLLNAENNRSTYLVTGNHPKIIFVN